MPPGAAGMLEQLAGWGRSWEGPGGQCQARAPSLQPHAGWAQGRSLQSVLGTRLPSDQQKQAAFHPGGCLPRLLGACRGCGLCHCHFCLPPCLQASASWCSITELSTTLFLVLEIIFRHSMHGFLHFTCEGERQHGSVTAQAGNSQQTIALTFFFCLQS